MSTIDLYGSSSFCLPAAELLLKAGYTLRIITTVPPSTHKSRTPIVTAPKEFATLHALPLAEIRSSKELRNIYTQWSPPDCAVVASFGRILPSSLLERVPKQFLNIHPSLLPLHRGPSPVQSSIIAGDTVSGTTIIVLDTQVDHGPILIQEQLDILPKETAEALKTRLAELGAKLILNVLPEWLSRTLTPQPQDDTLATMSRKISKDDGRIDWTKPATTIERQWRAYTPWPGLSSYLAIKQGQPRELIKLYDATITTNIPSAIPITEPGHVIEITSSGMLLVQAGERTTVAFGAIQRPGRKKMSIATFLPGFPQILESTFE